MSVKVTSQDGKVQVIRHNIKHVPIGPLSIQGAIKNLSTEVVSAQINIEFFDEDGNYMGPASEIISNLAAGETRLFEIWGERVPNQYNIESYKISSLLTIQI
jgi:hypothetical protein